MEVVDDLAACPHPPGGSAVTIGAYDGVHLGHQQLLTRLRAVAAERSCASAVVTFDRHPALVVRPDSAPKLLTDLDTKLELLAATGIDYAVVVHFDMERSREPAEDFIRTVLVGCLDARVVAVGRDFHFGHNREGNVALLERLGPSLGFEVMPVELFDDGRGGGVKVSSTRVRTALAEGDVGAAAALLGRPHQVRGPVVAGGGHGHGNGSSGDAVTIAIAPEICLPADGVYAGWFHCADGERQAAAVTVASGPNGPGGPQRELVAYLADVPGQVGGEQAVVEFTARLRDEGDPEALLARMGEAAKASYPTFR